jgi:cellulose synthase/poly-beta-1,6-N-acetylglucosamine synthase-like glycosyltransferase
VSEPVISVIVPVYNGEATIGRCIEALLAQSVPRSTYEVIIVDNNSMDSTAAVARNYGVRLLHEREMQTSYAARNRGIAHACGEILAFTDADCAPDPEWLARLSVPFADPRTGAVVGGIADAAGGSLVEAFTREAKPYRGQGDGEFASVLTANAAFRRDLVVKLGGFDEALPTAGDVDLGWRTQVLAACRVVAVPDAVVLHYHRTTVRGLFRQYRRYGFSEVLLATLYRGCRSGATPPKAQLVRMAYQCHAVTVYLLAFAKRLLLVPTRRTSRRDFVWPLLWAIADSGSLVGKCHGLVATRFFRRNPFPSRMDIRRCLDLCEDRPLS